MSVTKRVRKGISLLASFAMGAGLMIGTFAAPAVAVADSVTIDKVGGARYGQDYRDELHGQVCDFWFNYGTNFDTTYANEGVFINGTFSGPNAAEMELVSVTLVDLPADSENDLYELDWVDFNRYDRAGVAGWSEDAEMEECSSDHDFEVFMEDVSAGDSEFAYWDVPGDYTYRLAFANSFDGDGTVTLTQDVVVTIAGDVASLDLKLDGDKTSMVWPVQTEYFDEADTWIDATLTFLDADGNITSPLDVDAYSESEIYTSGLDSNFAYDSYDGAETEEIFSSQYLTNDWSEEIWIMSNDWDTGNYEIHESESEAAYYSEAHAEESGFGFNYTDAYFYVPLADDGSYVFYDTPLTEEGDYYDDWWSWSDDTSSDEIALKHGLVDQLGDFTGGVEVSFKVASDIAEVSNFWVRLQDADSPDPDPSDSDQGDPIDSNTVSVDFRDWVDPDTLGENTNIVAKTGVHVPGEWWECDWVMWGGGCPYSDSTNIGQYYYDWAFVRDDVGSFQTVYDGGVDEDGNPLNAGKFIAIGSDFLGLTTTSTTSITRWDFFDLVLTDDAGKLTVTASIEDADNGYYGIYNCNSICYISWDDADEWDNWGYGFSSTDIAIESAGFFPQVKLENASAFAKFGPRLYEPVNYWTQLHKSVLLGSTQTLTYKVTDVWGDVIAGAGMYLEHDCWEESKYCAEFAEYDDYEVTNAQGLVTYSVDNIDDPAEVASRHVVNDDCDDIVNCQEALDEYQGDAADYWTEAVFNVEVSDSYLENFFADWYNSEYVNFNYSRSTTVSDIYLSVCTEVIGTCDEYYDGTGDNAIQVDTEGDESEEVEIYAVALNSDGVVLVGYPYSISGTTGTYATTFCTEQGTGMSWWNAGAGISFAWGCWDYVNAEDDVSGMNEGALTGTANSRALQAYVTGTLVGTTTYSVTIGGYTKSFDQDYFNTVEDARFIAAVATDAANVIAGNIATATFKVTDRFGNVVEDVDVVFSESGLGEFLSNDPASTTGVTDADGLTSVDILTPANSMGSSVVTGSFETLQNEAANADFGIPAAIESANADVTWTHITPTIDVKALKYRAGIKVFVKNAVGNITRVYVDGKMKRVFVPATVNGYRKILLKKGGERTVVVTVASPLGNIFETFELKLKKNK